MAKRRVPRFESEADEARWWAEHQDNLEDYLDGEPRRVPDLAAKLDLPPKEIAADQARQAAVRFGTKAISLKMPVADLEQARRIADRKGLPYQSLLKSLIHEGLQRLDREAL
jgi:hypothetical protein